MALEDLCKVAGTYLTKELISDGRSVGKLTFTSEFQAVPIEMLERKTSANSFDRSSPAGQAETKLLFTDEIQEGQGEQRQPDVSIVVERNLGGSTVAEVDEKEIDWKQKIR